MNADCEEHAIVATHDENIQNIEDPHIMVEMHCEETENVMRVEEERRDIILTLGSQSRCPQTKHLCEEKNGWRALLFTSQEIPSSKEKTMASFDS